MYDDKRVACFTGTPNIYEDMIMCAKSLYANSNVEKIYFVCSEPMEDTPDFIEVLVPDLTVLFPDGGANINSKFTRMAMCRNALSIVLEQRHKRVLSLDSDIIFTGDISSVFDTDINDYYFAAVPEWHRSENGLIYTNHGFVLYNLKRMSESGKTHECVEALNRQRFTFVDQDVGNYLCQGRIKTLDATFNSCYWTNKNPIDPLVIHYAGQKRNEWINNQEVIPWRKMTWEEAIALHERWI